MLNKTETPSLINSVNGKDYLQVELAVTAANARFIDDLVSKYKCIDIGVDVMDKGKLVKRTVLSPIESVNDFQEEYLGDSSMNEIPSIHIEIITRLFYISIFLLVIAGLYEAFFRVH